MNPMEKQFAGLVDQILEKQPPGTDSPLEVLVKALLDANTETENVKCRHTMPDPIIRKETPANELGYQFCPKCGEKL